MQLPMIGSVADGLHLWEKVLGEAGVVFLRWPALAGMRDFVEGSLREKRL